VTIHVERSLLRIRVRGEALDWSTPMERIRASRYKPNARLIPHPPMLTGESLDDYLRLHSAFEDLIKPQDAFEDMLVADVPEATWEMLRFRRFKVCIMESARRPALSKLLAYGLQVVESDEADELSERFFSDPAVRKEVLQMLQKFNLNEGAIEAEAMRLVLDDLETVDKMLLRAEKRREDAFRFIDAYRHELAVRCRAASEVLLEQSGAEVLPSEQED
jgi:hypothetical protein